MWRQLGICLMVLAFASACGGSGFNAYEQHTPAEALAAFTSGGAEVGETRDLTHDDFGLAPYQCKDGIRFLVPSLGADAGGRIMSCPNAKAQAALVKYYTDLGDSSAFLFSWVYQRDNIVVQLNGDATEPLAKTYEAALNTLP